MEHDPGNSKTARGNDCLGKVVGVPQEASSVLVRSVLVRSVRNLPAPTSTRAAPVPKGQNSGTGSARHPDNGLGRRCGCNTRASHWPASVPQPRRQHKAHSRSSANGQLRQAPLISTPDRPASYSAHRAYYVHQPRTTYSRLTAYLLSIGNRAWAQHCSAPTTQDEPCLAPGPRTARSPRRRRPTWTAPSSVCTLPPLSLRASATG